MIVPPQNNPNLWLNHFVLIHTLTWKAAYLEIKQKNLKKKGGKGCWERGDLSISISVLFSAPLYVWGLPEEKLKEKRGSPARSRIRCQDVTSHHFCGPALILFLLEFGRHLCEKLEFNHGHIFVLQKVLKMFILISRNFLTFWKRKMNP